MAYVRGEREGCTPILTFPPEGGRERGDEGANLLGKGIECRGRVAAALGRAASLLRLDREKARKVELT